MNPPEVIENFGKISIDGSIKSDNPEANEKEKQPYENGDQMSRAFEMINVMRKSNSFCDVTLEVEGGPDIRAHRNILAACSPYFNAMFTNFKERDQDRVEIQDIQHSALEQLIDYIYTSKIFITEENVQTLYHAANYLQLTDVSDACCEFMKTQLNPSNCFEIRDFANSNQYEELLSFTNEYMEGNFWQIVNHDKFLALSPEKVLQLIASDHLAVPGEETIFESVISWVKFDLENRKKYLAELIENVRMPLLSRKYINERVKGEQFMIEALKYHMLKDEQKILFQTLKTKPRQPRNQSKVLLVIGNWLHHDKNLHDECYDFEDKKWYQVSELHTARFFTRLAVVEGRIYKMGDPDCKSIDVYDPFTREWSKCRDMRIWRDSFDVAVLDNYIYVVGGEYNEKSLKSVESYDPRQNEWQMIPSMLKKRGTLGVGVVNGFIYAIGGYDWESNKNLSSAERYDPEMKKWELIAEMSTSRNEFGVGVIDDILYVIGGYFKYSPLRSVEAYDPKTNEWKLVAEMSQCRASAGVVAYNGKLYVVGGFDGTSSLTSVEVFSPTTNSWTTLSTSMKVERYNFGVAIIDKVQAPVAIKVD